MVFRKTPDEHLQSLAHRGPRFRFSPKSTSKRTLACSNWMTPRKSASRLLGFIRRRVVSSYQFSSLFRNPLYAWSPPGREKGYGIHESLVAFFSAAWMGDTTPTVCMRLAQARTKTPYKTAPPGPRPCGVRIPTQSRAPRQIQPIGEDDRFVQANLRPTERLAEWFGRIVKRCESVSARGPQRTPTCNAVWMRS
jgi:hypothetical protein